MTALGKKVKFQRSQTLPFLSALLTRTETKTKLKECEYCGIGGQKQTLNES